MRHASTWREDPELGASLMFRFQDKTLDWVTARISIGLQAPGKAVILEEAKGHTGVMNVYSPTRVIVRIVIYILERPPTVLTE